jgi:LDH2 family malate/lactate/ureidoglycolate dehydrogenase
MKDFGREPLITSAFYLALDPERFMPLEEFRARIDRLVDQVKASEPASGVEEVLIAGEPEARCKVERLRDGIPLSAVVRDELREVARELAVGIEGLSLR